MSLDDMKNPIQPIGDDGHGVLRFKSNKIVRHLLDNGGIDLNQLHGTGLNFSRNDWEQFNQLIGYSVSGLPGLSLETGAAIDKMENGVTDWRDARIKALEEIIEEYRKHAKALAVTVFEIHPDDL